MARRISKYKAWVMRNPIIQLFKLVIIGAKVALIVTLGHGGTRKVK